MEGPNLEGDSLVLFLSFCLGWPGSTWGSILAVSGTRWADARDEIQVDCKANTLIPGLVLHSERYT